MHSVSMGLSSTPSTAYQISPTPSASSFVPVLAGYWYVFLVLLLVLGIATLFFCTCIIRKKRRQVQQPPMVNTPQLHLQRISPAGVRETSIQQCTSSSALHLGGSGTPGSLSTGRTPIPSPQPSFSSSHRSLQSGSRYGSGLVGGHKKRRKHHSPGHTSSGSEDTIKAFPGHRSPSLASSAATLEPHCSRLHQAESISSVQSTRTHQSACDSQSAGHRRSASNPNVKITAMTQESLLYSAPSTLSINSGHSNSTLPGPVMACVPEKAGMVHMDVKVHLEQGQKVAPCQIAAALAESARQLAQSAANFEQEERDVQSIWSRPNFSSPKPSHSVISSHSSHQTGSRRQLFPNLSSSKLQNRAPSLSLDRPVQPVNLDRPVHPNSLDRQGHSVSLDRPGHPVSLDRPVYHFSLDRPGYPGKGHPLSLERHPVVDKSRYLGSLNIPGQFDGQGLPVSLDRAECLDRPITLGSLNYPVSLNRQGFPMHLDRHGLPANLDRAECLGHPVTLDRPGHFNKLDVFSLDRLGHVGSLDREGPEVTLDGPRHPAMLDKLHGRHHAVNLDKPGPFRRSSTPLSLVHSSGLQDVMLDYKIPLLNTSEQQCSGEDGPVVLPQHCHHFNHSLQNNPTPSDQLRRKYQVQTEQERMMSNISLDLPPAQQLHSRQLQYSHSALTLEGGKRRPEVSSIENETELGTDSEIMLKIPSSHLEAARNLGKYLDGELTQQVSVSSLPHGNISMHVNEDSFSLQMQGSSLMSPPDSQCSSSILPRSGSGLSLEPTLGSTVSGYAATGSSSSTETISKSMQSSELAAETAGQGLNPLTQSLDSGYMQGWRNDRINAPCHMRDYRSHKADFAGHVMCAKDRSDINMTKSSVASKPYNDFYPEEHRVLQEDTGLMLGSPTSLWHHHQGRNRLSDARHDMGTPTWASKLDYAVHGPGESMDQYRTIPSISSKTIAIDI